MKKKQAKSKSKTIEHCFEGCLYFAVSRLYRSIDRIAVEVFSNMKIAPTHAYLIAALDEFGSEGATPSELSAGMNLDPSTVTRLISFLEKKKWIHKKKQGRIVKLALTSEGQNQMDEIQKNWATLYSKLSEHLGQKGTQRIDSVLRTLNRA